MPPKGSSKRPAALASAEGETPAKKLATDICEDSIVRCADLSKATPYIKDRCSQCEGLSVKDCLKLEYAKANGQTVKYALADLRYDIKGKRLLLEGGTPEKVVAPRRGGGADSSADKAECAKLASALQMSPLRVAKFPSSATSLAHGVTLVDGVVMPVVGFGTYKLKDNEVTEPVLAALQAGYRLIDTAQVYENEKGVGAALRQSGLPRESVFIETKVWRSSHGYERTMKACNQSLKKLGTDYIDLYVIHWPGCKTGWPLPRGTSCPPDWTPEMRDTGTWRAMEDLYNVGKVKAIGVTNYSVRHLRQLLKVCRVRPMVNQVEFHPMLVQSELLEFCKRENIAVQAYASLGSGDAKQSANFFGFHQVQAAATSHGKTPAQVLLRWAIDKGCHVVPKSSNPARIAENSSVFDFCLTDDEVRAIDSLHSGKRFAWKGLDPDSIE